MPESASTDPTGRSFVSYRRTRLEEVHRLVQAQHEIGIPTWQDVEDLDEVQTEAELRRVLTDPKTANAVLWLTPDVANSATIRNVEAPLVVRRERKGDGFFFLPVAAGGLHYGSAAALVNDRLGFHDLSTWNFRQIRHDPATPEEIRGIATRVLARRLEAVHRWRPVDAPLRLRLMTWQRSTPEPGWAALVDWSHRFQGRRAEPEAWDTVLLPALSTLREALRARAPGRPVEASGSCSISSGLALGRTFLSLDQIRLSWRQTAPDHPDQVWTLETPHEDTPVAAVTEPSRSEGTALAVLVSIAEDVEPAFGASRADLPPIRAAVRVRIPGENFQRFLIASPGQAAALAARIIGEVRRARRDYPAESLHLFAAIPVGLAVLLGQQLNTLGPIQIYEHEETDGVGRYRPELLLPP
jgi:hypothetical protein